MNIKPQVSYMCHLKMILSNYSEILRITFFAGKYLPPLHEIFVQKIPFKNVFDHNFFVCQPILKFCDKLNGKCFGVRMEGGFSGHLRNENHYFNKP